MKLQNSKRTFVVDDDPFWTGILTQMLNDLPYDNIVTFSNGKDCVDNLHLNPNLVFIKQTKPKHILLSFFMGFTQSVFQV